MNAKQLIRGHQARYLFCFGILGNSESVQERMQRTLPLLVKGHNYIRGYLTHSGRVVV